MPALLSFYERVDLDAAAIQVSVLEEVTYAKVMLTGGEQAFVKGKRAFKWLTDRVGMRLAVNTKAPKTTAELVMQRAESWRGKTKAQVHEKLFSLLGERLEVSSSDVELLSTRLIEAAAAGYGISESLLLSQQAEAIAQQYLRDCIDGISEQLRKQGEEEVTATDRALTEQLGRLTDEERLEIQKALNIQTLSAASLRNVIVTTGIPAVGIAAVQASGFGAYLALTTVMHAVFTSLLGITLPFAAYTTATSALSFVTGPVGILFSLSVGALGYFWGRRKIERSQYAMIVFACVSNAGRSLVPETHTLPSCQRYKLLGNGSDPIDFTPAPAKEDFELLLLEKKSTAQAVADLDAAIIADNAAAERTTAVSKKLRNEEEQLALSKARNEADPVQRAAQEAQEERLHKMIEALTAERDREKLSKELSEAEVRRLTAESEKHKSKYDRHLENRAAELRQLWSVHFPRMNFSPQALRWCANREFMSWLEIERALKELHDAKDPVKLSRSRMNTTDQHHSRFTIAGGVECRLFYDVKAGIIEVRRMCKKKDV